MLMRINQDLTKQEIWAEGTELVTILGKNRDEKGERIHSRPYSEKQLVAEIMDPVILTDINTIVKLEPTKRDTVFALYQSYPRTVEYDGVSVSWDPRIHTDVWGPSMDTIVVANAMRTAKDLLTDGVHAAVEIGCGSGFLGKYVLDKCRNLRKLHLVDINPYAVKCAQDNVERLHEGQIVSFSKGDGRKLAGEKYDLAICNAPYVIRPKSICDNPFEGIDLLYDMIVSGKNYLNDGGKLILTTSSLCERIKNKAIEEARNLASVDAIGTRRMPLKVNPVLNDPEWMAYLYENGLKRKLENGYEHWHVVSVLKLTYH